MRKIVLCCLVTMLGCVMSAQIPTAGLVGYWPMDGNAQDFSGNNNHGTVNNATLTCDRCGNPKRAYGFNGTNASIVVNNSPSVDMTNSTDFSVAFWIKTYNNPAPSGIPLSKNLYGSWSGYQFFTNNTGAGYCTSPGQISFYVASGALQDACSDNPVCTGAPINNMECAPGWNFITGVFDAAVGKSYLYVNGVQQADIGGISGTLSNTVNLVFGSSPNFLQHFKGVLDAVRIYKRKLTQSEINALYAESCNITGLNEQAADGAGLTAYPNPANDKITVEYSGGAGHGIVSATVYDVLGKQVLNSDKTPADRLELNISGLNGGIYFMEVKTEKGVQVLKFRKTE